MEQPHITGPVRAEGKQAMLILDVVVFLVILFFGLIWHDESPG